MATSSGQICRTPYHSDSWESTQAFTCTFLPSRDQVAPNGAPPRVSNAVGAGILGSFAICSQFQTSSAARARETRKERIVTSVTVGWLPLSRQPSTSNLTVNFASSEYQKTPPLTLT